MLESVEPQKKTNRNSEVGIFAGELVGRGSPPGSVRRIKEFAEDQFTGTAMDMETWKRCYIVVFFGS